MHLHVDPSKSSPRSPFGLIQEDLQTDPWKLLVCCLLLNMTRGNVVKLMINNFFTKFPDPNSVLYARDSELEVILKPLGLWRKRAELLKSFTYEFLNSNWTYPKEIRGIGKYADDCYRIFCCHEIVQAEDHALRKYMVWKQNPLMDVEQIREAIDVDVKQLKKRKKSDQEKEGDEESKPIETVVIEEAVTSSYFSNQADESELLNGVRFYNEILKRNRVEETSIVNDLFNTSFEEEVLAESTVEERIEDILPLVPEEAGADAPGAAISPNKPSGSEFTQTEEEDDSIVVEIVDPQAFSTITDPLRGWTIKSCKRTSGKTIGRTDFYYISPTGKKLRSFVEVRRELQQMNVPDIEEMVKILRNSRTK